MKSYFKKLLECINQNENIEEKELIQALFLLRAHYSLAGIVVICQRIFTLIGDDELPEFRDELNTLKIISRLQNSDQHSHFFSETTDRNKHKLTPLRPYTGDSGICDLLLIQAGQKESNERFDTVIIWFLEQIFYFQKESTINTGKIIYCRKERNYNNSILCRIHAAIEIGIHDFFKNANVFNVHEFTVRIHTSV